MMKAVPAEERLTNLVVALMSSHIGLTKQQILSSVSGYRQRASSGTEALEKMFERDKDELRALGVPIEAISGSADPNDLREARYRIPQQDYDLPDDIEFSPAELAVLRLAGSVWSAESASEDAQAGVRKIRALGIDGEESIIGFAPRLTIDDPSFAPLRDAIERCREVSFDYLKPGTDAPRRRQVRPLALVEYEGRWHVYGIDTAVDETRTFLLSRIVSSVKRSAKTFDPALREGAGAKALAGLEAVAAQNSAVLEVTPGTEAALRLGRRAEALGQGIRVHYVDTEIFADELAGYGPEVRVVSPDSLRDAVIVRLRAVVAAHSEQRSTS